jgi:hypothetical protein
LALHLLFSNAIFTKFTNIRGIPKFLMMTRSLLLFIVS